MAAVGGGSAGGDDLKTSWPEVVGWDALGAAMKINGDRPDVHFEVHRIGDAVPPGYDGERVRLFLVAVPGITVAQTPVVG